MWYSIPSIGFATPNNQKVRATVSLIGFNNNKILEIQKIATNKDIVISGIAEYELKKSFTVVSVHHFPTGDGRVINEITNG